MGLIKHGMGLDNEPFKATVQPIRLSALNLGSPAHRIIWTRFSCFSSPGKVGCPFVGFGKLQLSFAYCVSVIMKGENSIFLKIN